MPRIIFSYDKTFGLNKVVITAMIIPIIPMILPFLADSGLDRPFKAKINLIPFNPWPGSNYISSSPDQIDVFKK